MLHIFPYEIYLIAFGPANIFIFYHLPQQFRLGWWIIEISLKKNKTHSELSNSEGHELTTVEQLKILRWQCNRLMKNKNLVLVNMDIIEKYMLVAVDYLHE